MRRLHQLEEVGFVTSLIPYGHKDRGIYYLIDDEYCLFYLYWIEPNRKTIAKKGVGAGFWLSQSSRLAWKAWSGLSFESVCYKHIDQIRRALQIDPGAIARTWRYSPRSQEAQPGAQVDLLFDRPDGAITICEIKCSDTPFAIDKAYYGELSRKLEVFRKLTKTQKQLFLSMITTYGLKQTLYSEELVANQVTLQDLFQA